MPRTITTTANAIKSHKDPRLAGAVGVGAAAGVLAVSGDGLAVVSRGTAAAAGVLGVSEVAATAGVVGATAVFAGTLRGCAGSRVG
jgi:ABC-type cobalamin transport system permease subunit